MAGLEPNVIYVNLSGNDVNGPRMGAEYDYAPLCGDAALAEGNYDPNGTSDHPLSFNDFRSHIKHRLDQNSYGKIRTYLIQGSYTGNLELVDGGSGVFDIRYNSFDPELKDDRYPSYTGGFVDGYTVILNSWIVNEPYKLNLSATTSATNVIAPYGAYNPSLNLFKTYDIKLYVSNMQVQVNTLTDDSTTKDIGTILITNDAPPRASFPDGGLIDDEKYNNQIGLNNCVFITNGNGRISATIHEPYNPKFSAVRTLNNTAFGIQRYTDVLVSNCIFYSVDTDGVFFIRDKYPDGNGEFTKQVKYNYTIVNSIFLKITEMFRIMDTYSGQYGYSFDVSKNNYKQLMSNNVMSGSKSEYYDNDSVNVVGSWGRYLLYDASTSSIQYDFPLPSLTWNLATLVQDDFHYFENGWEDITVNGIKDSEGADPGFNVLQNQINKPASAYVSYPFNLNNFTYGVRDGVGALYFPEMLAPVILASDYFVSIDDIVNFSIEDPTYDTTYKPSSYDWYEDTNPPSPSFGDTDTASLTVDITGIIPITLMVGSHNNWYTVEGSTTIRSVIDQSTISLTLETLNKSNVNVPTFTVNDVVNIHVDVSPLSNVRFVDIWVNGSWVSLSLQNLYKTYTYTYIGYQNILCKITLTDNTTMYTSKTINIVEGSYSTYYVDLSVEYEKTQDFKLKNVIYDNFEDLTIDNIFATPFRNNYGVKYMYDEHVASQVAINTMTKTNITGGILNGNFNVLWTFVRQTIESQPRMIVNIDNVEYIAKWNYTDNVLKISKGATTLFNINYGAFSNDLTCPNALHKLYCKFVMVEGIFSILYSVDNGLTYKTKIINEKLQSFVTVTVDTQADSDSGYGYMWIEADNVNTIFGNGNALVKGTELYPYTYPEMVLRVTENGTGLFGDTYKCREWRETSTPLLCDVSKQFHIDVWDALKYGPWMIRFNKCNVSFKGLTLSNGIIYNIPTNVSKNISITTTYNMLITWNGTGVVILEKYFNRYTGKDKRVDIIGSTIKSESGFKTGG